MTTMTKWQRVKSNLQLFGVLFLVGSIPFYSWFVPLIGEQLTKMASLAAIMFIFSVMILFSDESKKQVD